MMIRILLLTFFTLAPALAENITVAAASDLQFAMEEILTEFQQQNADHTVTVVYGSSGRFHAQIKHGAPYDLYFSADIAYPEQLAQAGLAASPVYPYAIGRLVVWSREDDEPLSLTDLPRGDIKRIAIANPRHAPYGQRAQEAMESAGIRDKVEERLVLGSNIAQAAQFVETGNADAGIVALSLVLSPSLVDVGRYSLVPDTLHSPLKQGFIITRRAADNELAWRFADFINSDQARAVMDRYGFELPENP